MPKIIKQQRLATDDWKVLHLAENETPNSVRLPIGPLLVPLAVTSNQRAIRALGRRWRQLHTFAYVAPLLGLAHQWSQAKVGDHSAWPYALTLALLLGARLWAWHRGDQGEPAQPRAPRTTR